MASAPRRLRVARILVLALLASTLALVSGAGPAAAVESPPSFLTTWGTQGTGNNQFAYPFAVDVDDSTGAVYVVDRDNHRVQKFTATGAYVTQCGTYGTGNGQFRNPNDVAVDPSTGNVYVTDADNARVQKFTSTGSYLSQWGSQGNGNGQFGAISGLEVAFNPTTDKVYVGDRGNERIQIFTSAGAYLGQWGSEGDGDGQFSDLFGLAVDSTTGHVYVTDGFMHSRVQKFTADGTFVTKWGSHGTGNGQFSYPEGVDVDGAGNVYVVDLYNHRVQKFTSAGTYLSQWGSQGIANGQFEWPSDVAVNATGDIYVTDSDNHRIQEFGYFGRPDARIKKGATGLLVGNNVYNTTGLDQTRTATAARGSTVTYYLSVQNDAVFAEGLRLRGTASNTRFRVTYTAGGTDITDEVIDGTYITPVLDPGATLKVTVQVKVRTTAPAGSRLTASVTAKSDTHPTIKDKVVFVTSRA